jgi:plastocyanin
MVSIQAGETAAVTADELRLVMILSGASRMRSVLTAMFAVAALILAGCGNGGAGASSPQIASAKGRTVVLKSLMFMPRTLHVKVGTTVTWRSAEPITHTVTSGEVTGVDETSGLRSGQMPDGLFKHTLTGSGDTFSYTFTQPGSYSYYCSIHLGMNAKVVVTK